jgi:molecular chaperone DnaJ
LAPDHYRALGIDPSATIEQVKAAYRRQALKHHPDKNPGSAEAAERFKQCSEAYELLSDPRRRTEYDARLRFRGRGVQAIAKDLIDDFLGTQLGSRRDGQDSRFTLELPLREAALGVTRQISFNSPELCGACSGSGAAPGGRGRCPDCSGRGEIKARPGLLSLGRPCPRCGGQGEVITAPCKPCSGVGTVEQTRQYDVRLPPGVRDGDVKIIDGEGEPGRGGARRGDLHIVVRLQPHPVLTQDGDDLICEVPVPIHVVALGGAVEVPTIEGRVRMKIPAGTQTGRTFRLPAKGMRRSNGRRGDQLVRIVVETPVELDGRQLELLAELAESLDDAHQPIQASFQHKLRAPE